MEPEHRGHKPRALDTDEALESFFDNWRKWPEALVCTHLGVPFEVQHFGAPNMFTAIVLGWYYGIVDRVFKKRKGTYLRVYLPRVMRFDLWLESRWQRGQTGDLLEDSFVWSAIERDQVRDAFSGRVEDALRDVDEKYRLLITDEWVRLGPVPDDATLADFAEAVRGAVLLAEALSQSVPEEDADSAEEAEEEIDEAADADHRLIYRCTDALEAEFVQGMFRRHGIGSKVIGTRTAAILGAAPHIFGLKVYVPARHVERATALLEGVFGEGRTRRSWIDSLDEVVFQKKRPVALGIALMVPGGAHFYIMRHWTGLVLAACVLGGFAMALAGAFVWGIWLSVCGVITDLVVAQLSFAKTKRSVWPSRSRQLLAGLVFAILIVAVSGGLAHLSKGMKERYGRFPVVQFPIEVESDILDIEALQDLRRRFPDRPEP